MIVLNPFAYLLNEFSNISLFILLIVSCTKNRQTSFLLIMFLFSFPLTLLSMEDTLLAELAMTLLFILSRRKIWKASQETRLSEILGYLIAFSIYFIIPFIVSASVRFLLRIPFDHTINQPYFFLLFSSLLKWMISLLVVWIINKNVHIFDFSFEEKKIYSMQLAISLAIIISVTEILRKMNILGIVSLIMLVFLIAQYAITLFVTYVLLKKNTERQELKNLKDQLLMMNVYTVELERNYQEMRKFRHDYKNLLLGLNAASTETIDRIYLEEMIEYSHQMIDSSVMRFSGISNIEIVPIKSLIVAKLTQAMQAKINVTFECLNPIRKINLDVVRAVRVIGILLDNGIEAASESVAKKLNVLFILTDDVLELSIENSFAGKLPSLSLMVQEGFSKKGENRGLGLSNVKEILKNDEQVEMNHYSMDELFISTITIKRSE